jgi:hypothetical protein
MKVVALVSFVGRVGVNTLSVASGDEFDLPDGVDWLQAGLVAPVQSNESAPHMPNLEHAVAAPKAAEKRTKKA